MCLGFSQLQPNLPATAVSLAATVWPCQTDYVNQCEVRRTVRAVPQFWHPPTQSFPWFILGCRESTAVSTFLVSQPAHMSHVSLLTTFVVLTRSWPPPTSDLVKWYVVILIVIQDLQTRLFEKKLLMCC